MGLAGRSATSLERVRSGLGRRAAEWPLLEADAGDDASMRALARAALVVVTTVGPYRRLGLHLVAACCEERTDYVDLSGEVLFMRESIERYHESAADSGTRIVHACGFDSVPSDLAVFLLHGAAHADSAGTLVRTTLVVKSLRGGLSGGTLASMKGLIDDVKRDRTLRRVVGDPYALSPDRAREPDLGDESDLRTVRWDPQLGIWVGPFIMASANTRVVRRSNALQQWAYGRRFQYREVTGLGRGPLAPVVGAGLSAALGGLAAGLSMAPTRAVLDGLLPKPGEGPSAETQRNGRFRFEVHAITTHGARYVATTAARGDPGYTATARMLGESALALAVDRARLPHRAGVLTPATAFGTVLVERLRDAGHTLSVRAQAAPRGVSH